MHAIVDPSRCPSRIVTALLVGLLLSGVSAGQAQQEDDYHIFVSPSPATTGDPLVVTVTVPHTLPCAHVLAPVVVDGIVWVPLTLQCPPVPPDTFPVHLLLDPLPPGIWDIRLSSADLPTSPPTVIDSVALTVTDPRFSMRLAPSPATEEHVVIVEIAGEAACPLLSPPEIEQGRIRLGVWEAGIPICDPPVGPFRLVQTLGLLEPGEYLVELFFGALPSLPVRHGLRVAESTLLVLPAGTCVPGLNTLCLSGGRFQVEATGTNLGVSIVVTDTETGAVSDYSNAVGRSTESKGW